MINVLRALRPFLIGSAIVLGSLYVFFFVIFAGPVKETVIEQATGKPVEGAIVVVSWSISKMAIFGAVHVGEARVQETLTNKDGKFSFEPWVGSAPWGYGVESSRPQLLVAKPGFMPM